MTDSKSSFQSNALYLVRLRQAFRFNYSNSVAEGLQSHTNQMQAILKTREDAQVFIQTHTPIDLNPFAVLHQIFIKQDEFSIYHDEVEDDGYDDDGHVPESAGFFETDEGVVEGFISVRADATTTSFAEFAELCLQIGTEPPPLEALNQTYLRDNGLQREDNMKDLLCKWWDDQKNTMTSEQKATIWRTLHPRPYEIVQVPLER